MIKLIAFILLIAIFLIMLITAVCCLITAGKSDDLYLGEKQYEDKYKLR